MSSFEKLITPKENIQDVEYSDIMSTSYVSYAMSVIISRAVPDVRDGLKPVQRRILYDMRELGTTSDKPHRKSARITGDTMGKYHPHGDCLAGDTRIKLLSGDIRTIKELYEDGNPVWVLGVNDLGDIIPVKAHSFRIGQYTTKLYHITLTNGYTVTCTNNHPFLTIDGEWVKAENLHPNMILDVTIQDNVTSDYPRISHNLKGAQDLHRLVASSLGIDTKDIIHHKDENKLNCDPSNKEPKFHPTLRMLWPVVRRYRELGYSCEPEYTSIKNTSQVHTLSNYFTLEEYIQFRDANLPIISNIDIETVENAIPMYDFTVDDIHNMLICADDNRMFICAHNSSLYEAMVVMSQPWKKGQTLVDGHGNFGSIEGDDAAAQRYTEARLEKFSEETFLEDLKYDVVDMVPNYDETEKEPSVLPCKVPNILLNGAEGIAVGMTTSIPTHNLSEVIDTTIAYMRGTTTVESLMKTLPGPDFPTGGIISNQHELIDIYKTGKGKVKIRGKIEFEPGKSGEKDRLVVTEIPYTMIGQGINKFLQDTAKLVEDKVLPEIIDIINQSSGPDIRIVFEIKKNSDIERIKNVLYKKTKLEDTFGVNMLVVSDNKPQVMNLTQILDRFIEFQNQIYTRKYTKLLDQTNKKIEVDEGLIKAIDLIDVIIAVLRGSTSVKDAKHCLMTGDISQIKNPTGTIHKYAKNLSFTEAQADAILGMQLSRLVGLQLEELKKDYNKLIADKDRYTSLLNDPEELKKDIIKYLQSIKKKYGKPRRTEITDQEIPDIVQIETPEIELIALIDKFNYIHAIEKSNYSRNKQYIEESYVYAVEISSKDKLALFTNTGKVHMIPMSEIPLQKPRDKGIPIDNICQFSYSTESIVGAEALQNQKGEYELVFVTTTGSIKRTKNSEFFISRKTTDSTILREGEDVFKVFKYNPEGYIVLQSEKGFIIKTKQENIKLKSKYSQGNQGLKLEGKDKLKLVTTDISKYQDVKDGALGTTGKTRSKLLI